MGRGHPAGDRRADELGRPAGGRRGVQPRRHDWWPRPAATGTSSCGAWPPSRRPARPWWPVRRRSTRWRSARTASSWPPAARTGAAGCGTSATESQLGATMATGDAVRALTFSAGGTTLATAESDGATELWDVATQDADRRGADRAGFGRRERRWPSARARSALATGDRNGDHRAVESGRLSPAVGSAGHRHDQNQPRPRPGTRRPCSASGDILAVSDGRGTVRLWDVTDQAAGRRAARAAITP